MSEQQLGCMTPGTWADVTRSTETWWQAQLAYNRQASAALDTAFHYSTASSLLFTAAAGNYNYVQWDPTPPGYTARQWAAMQMEEGF